MQAEVAASSPHWPPNVSTIKEPSMSPPLPSLMKKKKSVAAMRCLFGTAGRILLVFLRSGKKADAKKKKWAEETLCQASSVVIPSSYEVR